MSSEVAETSKGSNGNPRPSDTVHQPTAENGKDRAMDLDKDGIDAMSGVRGYVLGSRAGEDEDQDNSDASSDSSDAEEEEGAGPSQAAEESPAEVKEVQPSHGQGPPSHSARNGNADSEEEEEEEEDDDDDDDEEEEEPSLKYQRLGPAATEILIKDTASALATSSRFIALGTHNGMVHVMSYEGAKINSFRPHGASVNDIKIDDDSEFIATASVEGRIVIHSLSSPEQYAFDLKRPMRAIALEPGFAKKGTRAFVCGGMAGTLIMHEKGWLGHKEVVLHSGEGPIWAIEWRGTLIAWANDLGVKIYDTVSGQRITFIDRPVDSPRAELFKCNLLWQDDKTLLIAWADHIKIARVRERARSQTATGLPNLTVEITAIFQVDCMISGICPYEKANSYLVLAYIAPDHFGNEATDDPMEQRRKAANRPELRIISKKGEEISSDALSLSNFHMYGCNDYVLVHSGRSRDELYMVVSPKDVVVARPRDQVDHINWLVDQRRFAEALDAGEKLVDKHGGGGADVKAIGLKYIRHLFDEGAFEQAASLGPKVFGKDTQLWEDWVFLFVQKQQLQVIAPFIPTSNPQLSRLVYDMIMAHFLASDRDALLKIIKEWPHDIYDLRAVIIAVQGELEPSKSSPIIMECLAELYVADKQPSKALPFFLRLRRPYVFDFIREHNLFSAVQDQVLLLVEFDQEAVLNGKVTTSPTPPRPDLPKPDQLESHATLKHGKAIALLVDHTYSIPIARVVNQLQSNPKYLYMYLDALFDKDAHLGIEYSDLQVELYAEYDYHRLLDFLRSSNYYSLEKAYQICKKRDFVPEMVFLLGRMGNNKQAMTLIIERLGDVERAIDFAKEQADEDLWEDLLKYSETRPRFIRGLLENVGADINPLRLIRRIKNGLEIPGLKDAVIKVLQASNLQVSLLEGCQRILHSDGSSLAADLQEAQVSGAYGTANTRCQVCNEYLFRPGRKQEESPLVLVYLCRHAVHATCALPDPTVELPTRPDTLASFLFTSTAPGGKHKLAGKALGAKLAYAATVRVRVRGCPVCHKASGQ